jgi:cytochrome c peroxidase
VAVAALVFACTGSSSSPSRQSADRVLGPLPVPPGNPQTPEKVELGNLLFFDKRLSADNTKACATCHDPARGWSHGLVSCDGCRARRIPRIPSDLARRWPWP